MSGKKKKSRKKNNERIKRDKWSFWERKLFQNRGIGKGGEIIFEKLMKKIEKREIKKGGVERENFIFDG